MSTLPATPLQSAMDAYAVATANLRLAEGAASRRGSGRMTAGERAEVGIMTRAVVKAAAQVVRLGGDDPLEAPIESPAQRRKRETHEAVLRYQARQRLAAEATN